MSADDNYAEARALAERYCADFNTQTEVRWLCRQLLDALADLDEREGILAYVGGMLVADVKDENCVPTKEEISAACMRRISERNALESERDSALREREEARAALRGLAINNARGELCWCDAIDIPGPSPHRLACDAARAALGGEAAS